jgi:membrane fusion protein (multidrug efflux system)
MSPRMLPILACVTLVGCGHDKDGKPQQASAAPTVNVVAVKSKSLDTKLSLPAQLTPYEVVDIYPKVTGFIERLTVDRGSRVKSGEVLVQLSAPELRAQRSQAEAAMLKSQSELSAAQAKLAADQATYVHLQDASKTPGVVAGNDLLVAEQTTAAAKAQVDAANNGTRAAEETLKSVRQLESYLTIQAPFDGIVTQRNLHPGALVGPSSGASGNLPIVQIESLHRLRLVIPIPEAYAAGVRQGQQVSFTVPEFPGETFRAPVARISSDLDMKTRTMPVELEVRNKDERLTPGSFATVQWSVQRSYPTLFVPSTAIATDLQRTFVVRVSAGKADWVDVKTGLNSGELIEVFGDLHAGDQIAARATDELKPGTTVQAKLIE